MSPLPAMRVAKFAAFSRYLRELRAPDRLCPSISARSSIRPGVLFQRLVAILITRVCVCRYTESAVHQIFRAGDGQAASIVLCWKGLKGYGA